MEAISKKIEELNEIVEKYPDRIPAEVVARFLKINGEGLKAALMRHNAPFGFGYQKDDKAYRVLVIPTVPFYLWYMNMNGKDVMSIDQAR